MLISLPLARTSISGGTRIALQFAEELANLGHKVTLVYPDDMTLDYFTLPSNVGCKSIHISRFARRMIGGLADILAIGRALPKSDIFLCNCWQMVYPALVSNLLRRGTRIVHLVQHLDSVIIAEKTWFYRWRNDILYRFIYRLPFSKKIVVSQWLKEALEIEYGQASVHISNGINIRDFTGGRQPLWVPPSETFDILCTGRLARWKGYQDILEAISLLAASNKQVRLVVASRENITIPSNIPGVLVKPQNDAELGYLYQHCSAFVMASWCEGFGLPALEAMACGAPVVTTACRGIDDFAEDGVNCLITPPKEPASLAEALYRLMMDSDLSLRLSQAGKQTGRKFTTELMAKRLDAVISRIDE